MSSASESLVAQHERIARERTVDLPAPSLAERLDTLAREGLSVFQEQGIPTRRLEDWKGTNLTPLEGMNFARVGAGVASAPYPQGDDSAEEADLIFLDGRLLQAGKSRTTLPAGIRVLSLAEAAIDAPEILQSHLGSLPDLKRNALVALNTALFEDVAVLLLDRRVDPGRPIRIEARVSAADAPTASFPRLLVVAEPESRALIAFESGGEAAAPGLTCFVAEFLCGENSQVGVVQLQSEEQERIHFTSIHARIEADARFESHVFSLGNGLVRSELETQLAAPGGETILRGFFLGRSEGHIDHFTTVDHQAPHCRSDEEYRGVLGDASKGVFRGRVIVRPDAQKSDARQSNPNLLLSDRAAIDTKPQLEIYADDVRASHGSTIGQLDAEALFFLRARGIDEAAAKLVLTRGFAREIVLGISDTDLRQFVAERVESALGQLHANVVVAPAPVDFDIDANENSSEPGSPREAKHDREPNP